MGCPPRFRGLCRACCPPAEKGFGALYSTAVNAAFRRYFAADGGATAPVSYPVHTLWVEHTQNICELSR